MTTEARGRIDPQRQVAADSDVTLNHPAEGVALITMDHPPMNALSWASRQTLKRHLGDIEEDTSIRCLVLTGTGRAFTSGANLNEDEAMGEEDLEDFVDDFFGMIDDIEQLRVPVIAAINGATVGGGLELAMACDIRIAVPEAVFVAAGVNVGLIANFWRLPRIVGTGPAKEILLTGDRYTADQALRWGLVTSLHERDDLLDAAIAKARRIATRAPLSVENTKRCATRAFEMDAEQGFNEQFEQFVAMFRTADHAEALRAFFERRDGDYQRS